MSRPAAGVRGAGACMECRRRSWLLENLSAILDYHRGDPARLSELLALGDGELIDALAGARRQELKRTHSRLPAGNVRSFAGGGEVCMHEAGWPPGLHAEGAPRMLWLTSAPERLECLLRMPTVSILGGPGASPYGAEMAGALARGLAAAGVTIVAGLAGEIARAAHRGVLEVEGGSLAIAGDGIGSVRPAAAATLSREIARAGCVVSELGPRGSGRGWGAVAAERTTAAFGNVAILVESEAAVGPLAGGRSAVSLGRPLGAVPGPLTSRLSGGPHVMIREGATLIRDAGDVLELLYAADPDIRRLDGQLESRSLEEPLRSILERVGAGEDTPERLARGASDAGGVLAALGELEAIGLLRRLPGGRYQARNPVTPERDTSRELRRSEP
jgi:DNA processing protein